MYDQYNQVLASDFNTFVGTVNGNTANALNTFWGVGFGNVGYGQPQVSQIESGGKVNATSWSGLFTGMTSASAHQGTSITALPTVTTGSRLNAVNTVSTDLTSCYANRLNAVTQGTTSTTAGQRTTSWSNAVSITHTVTFESGDKARYFFNSGGQISLNFSLSGGTTSIYSLFQTLASRCGTIYLSAPTSTNTASIAGTTYTGIQKIGGSGTPSDLLTSNGYYALTTTDTLVFKQLAAGLTPSGYINSFISVSMRSNGVQGSYGDAGSIITITTTFDEVPNNLVVDGTTTVNCTIRPPETTNLTNSWGSVIVNATTIGS
jgi:hypothetical protein